MKKHKGKVYPNGIGKARLYEVFLSYRDFGCSANDYALDLSLVRKEESIGKEHCFWYENEFGEMFLDKVTLRDKNKLIKISKDGFEFIDMIKRVFISYAKEDNEFAKRLYDDLTQLGFLPWIDEEKLLPGQKWEIEIESQIFESDYFIALISSRSVAKRGYVQREIRYALDVLDRIPDKIIYLIPARIDECLPSHRNLQNIHWVDLFPDWEKGLRKIIKSIEINVT